MVLSDNNSRCLLSMSTKQKGAQSKQSDIGAEKVILTKQEKKKAQYKAYYNANRAAISAHKNGRVSTHGRVFLGSGELCDWVCHQARKE